MAQFINVSDTGCLDLLKAARYHGTRSEPDHEVGDLQDVVVAAWAIMSVEHRAKLLSELDSLAEWSEDNYWSEEDGEV